MFTDADQSFYDGLDVSLGPGVIEELTATVARGLHEFDQGDLPRLSHVTQEQIDSDWCSLTFHVHITTDLLLVVDLCGQPREIGATQIIEAVRDVWPRRHAIVAAAETVRGALERCLHELGADKAGLHLRGVALAPVEAWTNGDTPALEADIDSLGDDLRLRRDRMHFSSVAADKERYRQLIETQSRRLALKRFMIERGVTGSMDQLTWAAIMALPEPELVLRKLGRHERIWPTEGLYLAWQEGRVVSSGERFQGLSWNGSHLEFAGVSLPATALVAAAKRPVILLHEHPLLSPAMIVSHAWQANTEEGAKEQVLVVEIEPVDHLFSGPLAKVDPRPLHFRTRTALNESQRAGDADEPTRIG